MNGFEGRERESAPTVERGKAQRQAAALGGSGAHFASRPGKRQCLQSHPNFIRGYLDIFGDGMGKDSGWGLHIMWKPLAQSWSFYQDFYILLRTNNKIHRDMTRLRLCVVIWDGSSYILNIETSTAFFPSHFMFIFS